MVYTTAEYNQRGIAGFKAAWKVHGMDVVRLAPRCKLLSRNRRSGMGEQGKDKERDDRETPSWETGEEERGQREL